MRRHCLLLHVVFSNLILLLLYGLFLSKKKNCALGMGLFRYSLDGCIDAGNNL